MTDEDSEGSYVGEKLISPLHIAASEGDTAKLSHLVSKSRDDINARDPSQYTPLQICVQNNDLASIRILISHDSDLSLEAPNPYGDLIPGTNALSLAASCGHEDVLKLLIENGSPITSKALHTAAESGRMGCVEKILDCVAKSDRGFDDDSMGEGIDNGLLVAAIGWRAEIVKIILNRHEASKGALDHSLLSALRDNLEYDDFHITDPVSRTTAEGYEERAVTVKFLVDAGADVNAEDESYMYCLPGMRPLHQVARMGNQAVEIYDLLLDNEAELDSKDEDGRTPLFFAVQSDNVYFVQRLIEKGAKVDEVDNDGSTPLHIATGNTTDACWEILKFLIGHGADLESKDTYGRTPLLHSVTMRETSWSTFRPEIVTQLLDNGADADAKDTEGLGLHDLIKCKGFAVSIDAGDTTSSHSGRWIIRVDNQG